MSVVRDKIGLEILATYEPLFEEAESDNLWFHCSHLKLWLSPDELKARHAKGDCIWGAVNWEIAVPPRGYVR